MKHLVHKTLDYLGSGEPVVVATIVRHQGSSPRSTGAKMVVAPNGNIFGTIGGGLMEAHFMEKAQSIMGTRNSGIVSYDLTVSDFNTMGMTCGGSVEVFLEGILPTSENMEIYSLWQENLRKNQESYFLTFLTDRSLSAQQPFHCILSQTGEVQGQCPLTASGEKQLRKMIRNLRTPDVVEIGNHHVVVEPSIHAKTLYIFGAGHVAVPTAAFAAHVGFDVWVMDDREEFAAPGRFLNTVKTRAVPDFENVFTDIQVNHDDFIVIITRGHLHDKTVLAQALKTDAAYIGMIGSKKKRDSIYAVLLEEGCSQTDIDRVHCPIGLAIGAETPEEIAISIVAELIQKRADLLP